MVFQLQEDTGKAEAGEWSAHEENGSFNLLGFVRQEDPLLGDLDFETSLKMRCRLLWPGQAPKVEQRMIEHVVAAIGIADQNDARKFLGKRIGSPLDRNAVMSGGERRRANVAHELLGHPIGMLMDEPTSGLAASDAQALVKNVQDHAKRYDMPILMSIHQPPRSVYALCDDLLLMVKPGRVVFHGSRRDVFRILYRMTLLTLKDDPAFKPHEVGTLKQQFAIQALNAACEEIMAVPEADDDRGRSIRAHRWTELLGFLKWVEEDPNTKHVLEEVVTQGQRMSLALSDPSTVVLKGELQVLESQLSRLELSRQKPAEVLTRLLSHKFQELAGRLCDRWESYCSDPEKREADFAGTHTPEAARRQGIYLPLTRRGADSVGIRQTGMSEGSIRRWIDWLRVCMALLMRGSALLKADRTNLVFLFLQGPILAILLLLAFRGHESPRFGSLDLFGETFNEVEIVRNNAIQTNKPRANLVRAGQQFQADWGTRTGSGPEATWVRAERRTDAKLIDAHARHRGTVLFVLSFAVLWMATVAGAKEIVQDIGVIIHEELLGVGVGPVIASRFLTLWLFSCWQSLPLVIVGGWVLEESGMVWFLQAYASMIVLGAMSTASGLLISAFSSSQRMALTIVPFITVPQVLFAGVLQSFSSRSVLHQCLAMLLPLRMGWESLMEWQRFWSDDILQFQWNGLNPINQGTDVLEGAYEVKQLGWSSLYFGGADFGGYARIGMILATVLMLGLLWVRLRGRINQGVH